MKPRLSKLRLLQELRKLLIRPDLRIRKRKLRLEHGSTTWNYNSHDNSISNIIITVDLRRDNLVSLVIHELLHVYLAIFLKIDKYFATELEESIILGLETSLYHYLRLPNNDKLLESWAKAIERKLS